MGALLLHLNLNPAFQAVLDAPKKACTQVLDYLSRQMLTAILVIVFLDSEGR